LALTGSLACFPASDRQSRRIFPSKRRYRSALVAHPGVAVLASGPDRRFSDS